MILRTAVGLLVLIANGAAAICPGKNSKLIAWSDNGEHALAISEFATSPPRGKYWIHSSHYKKFEPVSVADPECPRKLQETLILLGFSNLNLDSKRCSIPFPQLLPRRTKLVLNREIKVSPDFKFTSKADFHTAESVTSRLEVKYKNGDAVNLIENRNGGEGLTVAVSPNNELIIVETKSFCGGTSLDGYRRLPNGRFERTPFSKALMEWPHYEPEVVGQKSASQK